MQGARLLAGGEAEVVLVGGTESMSQAPLVLRGTRWGWPLGKPPPMEDMLWSALTDSYAGLPMAMTAEKLAEQYRTGRFQQARENRADRRFPVGAQRLVVEREEHRGVVREETRCRRGVTAADGVDERTCHAFGRADGRRAGKYEDREERSAAQWPRRAGSRKSGWFCSSPTIRSSPLLL